MYASTSDSPCTSHQEYSHPRVVRRRDNVKVQQYYPLTAFLNVTSVPFFSSASCFPFLKFLLQFPLFHRSYFSFSLSSYPIFPLFLFFTVFPSYFIHFLFNLVSSHSFLLQFSLTFHCFHSPIYYIYFLLITIPSFLYSPIFSLHSSTSFPPSLLLSPHLHFPANNFLLRPGLIFFLFILLFYLLPSLSLIIFLIQLLFFLLFILFYFLFFFLSLHSSTFSY